MRNPFFTKLFSALLIVMMTIVAMPVHSAHALTTTSNPTGCTTGVSSWASASSASGSDDVRATVAANNKNLTCTYNISIPAGSTILGIEVLPEGSTGGRQANVNVSWDSGATLSSTTIITTFNGVEASITLGGAANTWGHTWTVAELTTFAVRLNSDNTAGTLSVDNVAVRITYTPPSPTITSATYNASTGALVVTGANMTAGDTIDLSRLTLTGEGGSTYILTTVSVTASSATTFSATLNATDRAALNQILNKNGTTSTGGTTYNLAAADDWDASVTTGNTADATNAVTVSNVSTPTLTSATYNTGTGALVVTGTGFLKFTGATNDIDVSKLTVTGEGGSTYTLTTAGVEITSGTSFTVNLNATDIAAVNQILNKNGTSSTGGTTYNLAGAEDWNRGADAAVVITDLTGNGITVSGVVAPTITSATYNASTGALVVTGTGFLKFAGATNDIDVSKLTITGEGGSTYTLTTPGVEITSGTSFTVTLNATDIAALKQILNKNGTSSTGGTTYNLAGAEDWNRGADAAVVIADLTGNGITVSGVVAPTITSATYNASTGVLVVTGTGYLSAVGATNDIVANKFTFTGQGGGTYTLTTTPNVDVTSGTSFTLTLSVVDRTAVNLLLNKNGTSSIDATTYNLAAAEDWNAGADVAVVIADLTGNGITVSNVITPTTTTITADSPDASVTGQQVAITVTVSGASPTGTVDITGADTNCSITIAAGTGSCNATFTSAGAKTLTATYNGDVNNGTSSDTEAHTVNKADTTAAILSDAPDPSVVGQSVTVTYSVSVTAPGSGTPTGNVLVSDGVNSCTDTVAAGTCNITLFTPGIRTLTATYQGDTNFNASAASAGAGHQVNKANTTSTITSDIPDPSAVAQSVTVNFTVATNAPGSGTPTGNVTVSDGVDSCIGTVAAGTCNITLTTLGARTLTATYAGDTSYNGSTSAGVPHQVNTAGSTTTITADTPDPSIISQLVAVTVTVTGNSPTGTVDITGADTNCSITLAVGTGSCNVTFTSAGAKTLTATYNGDVNNGTSSDTEAHDVNTGPVFTSANNASFDLGFAGTFNITATGNPTTMTITAAGALPTGVTLTDNGNGTATLSGTPAAGTAGVYNLVLTANNGVNPNGTQNFTLTVRNGPTAANVNSSPDTGDATIVENEIVSNALGINQLIVTFDRDVRDVLASTSDTDEVDNPNNYRLLYSTTGVFNTLGCGSRGGAPLPIVAPDIPIPVTSVAYSNGGGSGPFVASVTLGTTLVTDGYYRLYVCGTTSIVDAANPALALAGDGINPGSDFIRNFQISTLAVAGGGGGGGRGAGNRATNTPLTVTALPATGFAPNRVTILPEQPEELAYTDLGDLWVEIPALGVKSSIVGVPMLEEGEWDVTWLGNDVGWLNGTAFPSWEGNSVLTAHVTNASGVAGPFAKLTKLKYGDQIIIHAFGQKYIFEVHNSRVTKPFSTSFAFEHLEDESYLTLITCQVYMPKSDTYLYRRVIRAVLIEVQDE